MPGWLAVIVQVPALTSVIVDPLTVQTGVVDEVSVTGSPEVAVGLTVNGDWSMVELGGLVNVMDWGTGATGATAFEGADAGPVPTVFVAVTVKV